MAPDDPPAGKPGRKFTAKQRAGEAARLRRQGYSYDQIAERLGYANSSGAWKAADRAIEQTKREQGGRLLGQELSLLDDATRSLFKRIEKGQPAAINSLIRIMNHRAKLMGLYEQRGAIEVATAKDAFAVFMQEVVDEYGTGDDAQPEPEDDSEPT